MTSRYPEAEPVLQVTLAHAEEVLPRTADRWPGGALKKVDHSFHRWKARNGIVDHYKLRGYR